MAIEEALPGFVVAFGVLADGEVVLAGGGELPRVLEQVHSAMLFLRGFDQQVGERRMQLLACD